MGKHKGYSHERCHKKEIYGQADLHVQHAAEDIKSYQNITEASIKRIRVDLTKEESDHENLIEMLLHRLETQRQLQIIYKSPYFVRCDVEFEDEKGIQTFYFGRFAFREDAIFPGLHRPLQFASSPQGNFPICCLMATNGQVFWYEKTNT